MNTVSELRPVAMRGGLSKARPWPLIVGAATALLDFVAVLAVVVLAAVSYHLVVYAHTGDWAVTAELALFVASIFVFTNMLQRRYRVTRYLNAKGQIAEAFNVWNVTMVAFIAVGFLAKTIDTYSRAVVLLTYLAGVPLVALTRYWVVRLVTVASKTGRISAQRVLLVGREADVMAFVSHHQPWNSGLMIEELVILPDSRAGDAPEAALSALRADLDLAVARARLIRPDSVFIALPWSDRALIDAVIDAFITTPVAIHLAPEPILDRFDNPRIIRTGGVASLELTPPPLGWLQIILKRAFDLTVATVLLFLLSPLFLALAAMIKLDSPGPALFRQRRYGFNQQPFRIYKFRTMRVMEDGDTIRQATANDPRITRVGAWLRKLNLDELPQLLNVIEGHMSLVGPRPHALSHDEEYMRKIGLYARRHNVKPGITGWAQVHGLRGETDTDDKMARRVSFDLWYIDNWSLWLDIVIMLRTVFSPKAFRNAR
jgi:Undecaprenyl-phosphate glucose phosphotransferase